MKLLREWKKVLEADLEYIVSELKEAVKIPAVIILSGEVGAGKTTFCQHFIHFCLPELKSKGEKLDVTSPSYSLINEFGTIAHADFYRLKKNSEVLQLELPLYAEKKEYFLIEWGKPFIQAIHEELFEEFSFYELAIDYVADGKLGIRNFCLREVQP